MTPNARHLKWKLTCLALVLICQTTRQTEAAGLQVTRRSYAKRDVSSHHEVTSTDRTSMSPRTERMPSRETNERSAVDMSDGKIVFPSDDGPRINEPMINTNMEKPPVCQGSTFCENISQYPKNLVDLAILQNNSLRLLATVDVTDIEKRIHTVDETPLCNSVEKVVFPQSAENTRNEWLFIVNQDNFKQGVRVEVCSNEGQKCHVIDGFADNYQTMCKQKYVFRELVALGTTGKVTTDTFRFAASCCCRVNYIGGPTPRSAR